MTQALYRKYRPQNWTAVIGQDHIVTTLTNAIKADRVGHAYLFAGPRGTGKTTLARLLAKAVNCTNPDPTKRPCNQCENCKAVNENRFMDLIEIDAASNTSVDDVRDLRDKINFSPSQGVYKVYVVDECFRYEDTVTLADGSKMPIGKLVKEELSKEVLSYNEKTGEIEPKPIVRWMSKHPVTPTIRVTFDNNRAIICTINHKFYTPSGLCLAGHLEVGDFVYSSHERITQHRLSAVAGAAIGDGHNSLIGTRKLNEVIAEYVPPDMEYKLLPEYRGRFVHPQGDESESGLAVSVVRSIEEVDQPDYVYNIEVADNHNYFVRDLLVANCHMLSVAAFNALLKTLEEPPPHAIFVLATTEIHKIPATVLSRCQRHEFRRLPVDEIVTNLKNIVKAENIQTDEDALIQIARQSAGGMRDAISLLDQLSSTGDKITLALAQTVLGTATSQTVLDVLTSIMDHDPASGLEAIHRALDAGADPRSLARQIVEYLRGLMLIQMGNANQVEATADVKKQMQVHAKSFSTSDVLRMMKAFNNAAVDLRGGWQPSLSLELALAEVLDSPAESPQPATPSQPKPRPATVSKTESKPKVESEAPDPAEKSAVSAGNVIKAWKRMSASLPKSQANLSALMNSVKMIDVQGKMLILGLASDVLVTKIDKPDQIEAIQKLIKDEFGADVSVRCVVTNVKGKIPPNVAQDGMVAAAIQHGGEIVDTQ